MLDTTVRKAAVDQEDLKSYWKSEQRPYFSRWSTIVLLTSFSKTLLNTASMYESSGLQFFRTTTGIQSGPNAFDESTFAMTILTALGVTGILCSFRLVLAGKTGKEIPESSRLEFLEKLLATSFALSDAEDNTSRLLNRGGIADLTLNINSPES